MSRVLVTGADGFVGGAVCRALTARGDAVVEATRATVGDIGPETDWTPVLAGVDAVVHLAARVHRMRDTAADPLAEFRRVNVAGARRLAVQAAAAGVRRIVFASSIKVNGEHTETEPFSASDLIDPRGPYAVSKAEAEAALWEIAKTRALQVAVLRPPLVHGPGVRANFLALLRLIDRGLPLPFDALRNRRSLVALDNLADALLRCVDHPAAAGRVWLVRDGADLTLPELVRVLARGLERPARLVPVPDWSLRAAGRVLGRPDAVARLVESLQVDDSPLRRDLGWTPPVPPEDALLATAAWYRRHHG